MNRRAFIEILFAGLLWGLIGLFVRLLNNEQVPPMGQVAWRSLISGIVMCTYLAIKNPAALKIDIRDIWMFICTGIVSFVLFNYCYFGAISKISLSLAAVLLYTAPVFVMLLSRLVFKEPMTLKKTVALVLAFLGCWLSAGAYEPGKSNAQGMILGLLSGFLYALYSIFGRFALKKYSAATVTTYTFLTAAVASAPFAGTGFKIVLQHSWLIWFTILFAVVSGALPYLLYTSGLAKISPDRASIIASVEPVMATAVGAACFKEPLTPASTAGIILVITAIVLLNTRGAKNTKRNTDRLKT